MLDEMKVFGGQDVVLSDVQYYVAKAFSAFFSRGSRTLHSLLDVGAHFMDEAAQLDLLRTQELALQLFFILLIGALSFSLIGNDINLDVYLTQ
jgi:hypothetical protein